MLTFYKKKKKEIYANLYLAKKEVSCKITRGCRCRNHITALVPEGAPLLDKKSPVLWMIHVGEGPVKDYALYFINCLKLSYSCNAFLLNVKLHLVLSLGVDKRQHDRQATCYYMWERVKYEIVCLRGSQFNESPYVTALAWGLCFHHKESGERLWLCFHY